MFDPIDSDFGDFCASAVALSQKTENIVAKLALLQLANELHAAADDRLNPAATTAAFEGKLFHDELGTRIEHVAAQTSSGG